MFRLPCNLRLYQIHTKRNETHLMPFSVKTTTEVYLVVQRLKLDEEEHCPLYRTVIQLLSSLHEQEILLID